MFWKYFRRLIYIRAHCVDRCFDNENLQLFFESLNDEHCVPAKGIHLAHCEVCLQILWMKFEISRNNLAHYT